MFLDVIAVTPPAVTVRSPVARTQPILVRARRRILGGGEVVTPPAVFCTAAAR